jgi:glutamate transport system permease protein
VLLVGCGSSATTSSTEAPASSSVAAATSPGSTAAGSETGRLFSLLDLETGKVVGFDAGLSQMLAQYILGEPTELTVTTVDTRETLIQNGSVDGVFATYSITPANPGAVRRAGAPLPAADSVGLGDIAAGHRRRRVPGHRQVRRQRPARGREMGRADHAAVRSFLWDGLVNTMKLTVVSGVLALPLGVLFALLPAGAQQGAPLGRHDVRRGVPVGAAVVAGADFVLALPPLGINLPIFWKICVPIVMVNAAILAEMFRAGVNALPKGQLEASLAIGLTYWQAMRLVIFPQATRLIIPALVTQLVSLLKYSTLGYAASFPELLRTATVLTARTHTLIQVYIVISLIYVIINLLLSYLARVLERRLNRTRVQRSGDRLLGDKPVGAVLPMEVAPGGAITVRDLR